MKSILLSLIDVLVICLALFISGYSLRDITLNTEFIRNNYFFFLTVCSVWLFVLYTEGHYTLETYNPKQIPKSLFRGAILSLLLIGSFFFISPKKMDIHALKNIFIFSLIIPYMLYLSKELVLTLFSHRLLTRSTLLIGSPETIGVARRTVEEKPFLGYEIHSFMTADTPLTEEVLNIELIAIDRKSINHPNYKNLFARFGARTEIMDLALFTEKVTGKIPLESIDEAWFLEYCGHRSKLYDFCKGLIDRTTALLMIIGLIPLAFIILPIVWICQGRPLLYSQIRTGRDNKEFRLYKLRTMILDAEKVGGAQWCQPGDTRITKIGNFLRKTRIDELPQLYNILKGEMSLVGPRPERPEIISKKLAPDIPFYNLRLLVKPGVTGWAQVAFKYASTDAENREKTEYDLFYVKNRSLILDVKIILKTIKTVLTGAGQ